MTPRELDHTWVDPWADLSADRSVAGGWSHTSAAVTRAGDIVVGASSEPTLLFLDRDGHVRRRVPTTGLVELHGFALVEEAGAELLWIADSGAKDTVVGADVDWTPSPQGGGVALGRPRRPHVADAGAPCASGVRGVDLPADGGRRRRGAPRRER